MCLDDAFTGMGTVIQRFDSALRLNVHFHTLVLDGVYVTSENGERRRFLRLPRPSEDDVYEVAMRTAKKVRAYLEKRGRTSDSESNGEEAGERLTETGDGDEFRYELKKAWRDGTRFVRLDPQQLLARICAMVPPPWFNMTRFHGVLAPNAKLHLPAPRSRRGVGGEAHRPNRMSRRMRTPCPIQCSCPCLQGFRSGSGCRP